MKSKLLIILLIFILYISFVIPPQKTHAIGVIGSNAVKQSVLSTWEKAGITYTSREAKERAFDAWNMKAYEKWKADEVAGRNKEYWENVNSMLEGKTLPDKTPIDNVEGFGKVLLDWTFVGLAISLGNEVAKEMQESSLNAQRMGYLGQSIPNYEGISLNRNFNIREEVFPKKKLYYITGSDGVERLVWNVSSPYEYDPDIGVFATGVKPSKNVGEYSISFKYISKYSNGNLLTGTVPVIVPLTLAEMNQYEIIPKAEHLPAVNIPQPLQDLASNPYHAPIPEHLPKIAPLEVNVPLDESFWEGSINTPYELPENIPQPPDNPDNPVNPVNPNNPVNPTRPNSPEKPIEETPEYPDKTDSVETPSLFGKLWEWLKAILDVLFKILNSIIMLPFTVMELLWDFLIDIVQALFIPDDGYWDKNMEKLKKLLWADEIEELQGDFENLSGGSSGSFKDVIVNIMGVNNVTVIDSSSINSILDTIHKWVRGVIYPLILLFNINSLYKMIRGTSLMEITRTARYKAGE